MVVLPTGSGKSQVGLMAIAQVSRSALVVAPTIDLMNQWYDLLCHAFQVEVGLLGGGYHELEDLTVATYDSAYMHMERYGNRFGLIVFDEVHHLPGRSFAAAAEQAIAPFRLGLTATLERPDGAHERVFDLVGPVVYRREITDLAGDGDHYAATVVSAAFKGKTRVQQHQIVYAALKGHMGGALHALALTTSAPA